MTEPGHAITQYGFRLPDDVADAMTDEDVAGLVGRTGTLDLFGLGFDRTVRVTAARRVDDEWLGPGVWVEAVGWDPPADPPQTWPIHRARICPLDADGNPTGGWIEL